MSDVIMASAITATASILCQMIVSSRTQSLVAYRVDQLEKKVDKLHGMVEEIYRAKSRSGEGAIPRLPHFTPPTGDVL